MGLVSRYTSIVIEYTVVANTSIYQQDIEFISIDVLFYIIVLANCEAYMSRSHLHYGLVHNLYRDIL